MATAWDKDARAEAERARAPWEDAVEEMRRRGRGWMHSRDVRGKAVVALLDDPRADHCSRSDHHGQGWQGMVHHRRYGFSIRYFAFTNTSKLNALLLLLLAPPPRIAPYLGPVQSTPY